MTTIEILKRARALLIEKGWCQGVYTDGAGSYCMLGACLAAQGLSSNSSIIDCVRARNLVEPVLAKVVGPRIVTWWNDTPGRTKDEVLAAFDKAIELAERARRRF